jgi:hypothetical protein
MAHMRTLASNTEQDLQLDTTPERRTLRAEIAKVV